MSDAVSGHGALIAVEPDPSGAQGTFQTIGELNGDIPRPEMSRGESEVTPHNDNIDSWVFGVLRRGPLTFSVNFIFDDAEHDHLTGLYDAIITNERRGYRLRGPGGSDSSDEWICSGNVQAITPTDPVREGARTADVTIRMSGPMIIDGVAVGA